METDWHSFLSLVLALAYTKCFFFLDGVLWFEYQITCIFDFIHEII